MIPDRRKFLRNAGGALAAGTLLGSTLLAQSQSETAPVAAPQTLGALTKHVLPDLPYTYGALEPYIDAQTMELHHNKHHQAYVSGLNKAEEELAKARGTDDYGLIEYWSKKAAFNGGGHFLHSLFWRIMAPASSGGGGEPGGDLAAKINEDFGSFKALHSQFSAAAAAVEGSGWALLHYRSQDHRLIVLQAENQHKLSPWGTRPILGLDVWEHAYYLKYQNRRADYIAAWWNVVNWPEVAANLKAAMAG